jgi:uncharacterized small protein (DUF1192 family)
MILGFGALGVMAKPEAPVERRLSILDYKVAQLERKVAGMQREIAKFHAKKADK